MTNLDWIADNIARLYDDSQIDIGGIDINAEAQIKLFEELSKYFSDYSFLDRKEAGYRYYSNNVMFAYPAGIGCILKWCS